MLGSAHIVAVARSTQAQQRALEAGADEVLALTPDPTELASRLHSSGPFDLVLDPVFGRKVPAAATALAIGGRIVTVGGASGDEARFSSALLRSRSAAVLGYTNSALTPRQRHEALSAVFAHAADGAIAVVHETRPLSDAGEVSRDDRRRFEHPHCAAALSTLPAFRKWRGAQAGVRVLRAVGWPATPKTWAPCSTPGSAETAVTTWGRVSGAKSR